MNVTADNKNIDTRTLVRSYSLITRVYGDLYHGKKAKQVFYILSYIITSYM